MIGSDAGNLLGTSKYKGISRLARGLLSVLHPIAQIVLELDVAPIPKFASADQFIQLRCQHG